jgi:hypothetical protein
MVHLSVTFGILEWKIHLHRSESPQTNICIPISKRYNNNILVLPSRALYMFRALSAPIIRSIITADNSNWYNIFSVGRTESHEQKLFCKLKLIVMQKQVYLLNPLTSDYFLHNLRFSVHMFSTVLKF